jgi:hypothetical protein
MKRVITSLLAIVLTGCSTTIWDKLEKPLKPAVNETNYWKVPCIWDGTTLKKPYEPRTN